jgi:catalase
MTGRPILTTTDAPGAQPPQAPRDRAPERVVHAKGCGAFGTFTVTGDLTRFTRARLFARIGKQTDLLMRFSTAAGDAGTAHAERDVLGFSTKFYTEDGNWDLVGSNTPVFFVRDPLKFPELMRTQKRDPHTNLRNPAAMWDFWSRHPETLHQITILMSDRGRPASPRFMNGYGGNTYSFINEDGERFWVKFHIHSLQGLAPQGATGGLGYRDDLVLAIARGDGPTWRLSIQVMPEAEATKTSYNPFDLTKIWPHAEYPLQELGIVALDRNAADEFADIEQAAFSPSNVVPGIGFSPDKMLQARIFSYADAHRHRLGAQYAALPVNAPKVPPQPHHRGGTVHLVQGGGADFAGKPTGAATDKPLKLAGDAARATDRTGNDDFSQPRALFALMDDGQKQRLFHNIAGAMRGVPEEIVERQIGLFRGCETEYAAGVTEALRKASLPF